ncbi:MAG: peptide-methionine (S)-S-oxide reductase MsrA, partial [Ignavibacteria bacterium]|nr:peptide-methionine (S)-S-oxide reductase MsrA [Ignavibacteria bacterium]
MLTGKWWTIIFIATGFAVFYLLFPYQTKSNEMEKNYTMIEETKLDTATFGSGCFWCTEAIFERLKGVMKVTSGYSGGNVPNPGYEAVCTGKTGHAEVTQILYDPNVITFVELLEVFWKTHDPTTLNRQGNDVGTQYRSVIFFHNDEQKKLAEKYKLKLNEAK